MRKNKVYILNMYFLNLLITLFGFERVITTVVLKFDLYPAKKSFLNDVKFVHVLTDRMYFKKKPLCNTATFKQHVY